MELVLFAVITIGALFFFGYFYLENQPLDVNKITDLSEIFPIQAIEDGCLINGNGDITIGFKVMLPDVFLTDFVAAQALHNDFISMLKILPDGATFQSVNFYYTDQYTNTDHIENIVQKENIDLYKGRTILNNYTYFYFTFTEKFEKKKNIGGTLQTKPNFIFKQPFGNIEKRIKLIGDVVEKLNDRLNDMKDIVALRMDTKELGSALYDFMNMSFDKPCENGFEKVVNPIEVDSDGVIQIGNKFIGVFSLIEEGSSLEPFKVPKTASAGTYGNGISYNNSIKSKTSMVFPLACGLPIPHILMTTIEVIDKDTALSMLASEKSDLSVIATFSPVADIKQKHIDKFVTTITNHDFEACRTSVNILVPDISKAELTRKAGFVETALANMNSSKCVYENYDAANILFSMIPGNPKANYRSFVNTTEQAISYVSKEGLMNSDSVGYIYTDRFGKPVVIDLWNDPTIDNRNKLIIAPSGTGKSVWMNNYVNQGLILGNHIILLDVGRSYEKLCLINNGLFFDSARKELLSFNIFLCKQDSEGNYLYRDATDAYGDILDAKDSQDDKLTFIVLILSYIWKEDSIITVSEKMLLTRSVQAFYDYVNTNKIFPDFNAYYKFLKIFDSSLTEWEKQKFIYNELELILSRFADGGELDYFLNGKTNIDILNEKFIVFELEAIKENKTLFQLMGIIIIDLSLSKTKQLVGIAKEFIIDEGLDMLLDDKMGDYIAGLYRKYRKKDGAVTLLTQDVRFLKAGSEINSNSIIANSATQILLKHDNTTLYPHIRTMLSWTKHDIDLLDSLTHTSEYREFIIRRAKKSMILRNELSDFSLGVFDSRQKEVKKVMILFEKLRSMKAAVYQYLEDKKNVA